MNNLGFDLSEVMRAAYNKHLCVEFRPAPEVKAPAQEWLMRVRIYRKVGGLVFETFWEFSSLSDNVDRVLLDMIEKLYKMSTSLVR